jgi:hypothetical protein
LENFINHNIGPGQGDQMRLWKNRPKCSPTRFLSKLLYNFHRGYK